jgi:hypothetical protein
LKAHGGAKCPCGGQEAERDKGERVGREREQEEVV